MTRPSDRLVDEHGHPLAGTHTLTRAACEDEFDYLTGELRDMAGRGEQHSDLYAAIADRARLLADKLDEYERLTPTRAQLRELAGLGSTERGAFDRGGSSRVPGNPLLVPAGTGRRIPDDQGIALRSGETVQQWGQRTGRIRDEGPALDFGRLIRGMATDQWDGADAEYRAVQSEGSPGAGGVLVPVPISGTIIDFARNATRVAQLGAQVVPMVSSTLKIPRLLDGVDPQWRNENDPVAEDDLAFDAITLTARSLATRVRISVELVDDAPPAPGVIEREFGKAFATKIDRLALMGTGVVPEPRGLRGAGSQVPTFAFGGANGSALSNYDLLLDGIAAVRSRNYEPTGALMSPRTDTSFAKLKTSAGDYLVPPATLANFPRLTSNQLPVNLVAGTSNDTTDIYVGQWSMLAIGVRIGLRVRRLDERYMDSMQFAFQADWRGDIGILQPNAFYIIQGVR